MQIRQKQLLDIRLAWAEVPWEGRHYTLHLLGTSCLPEVGGSSLCPCKGPLMYTAQFLSHGLPLYMLPNHSARALCLWDDPNHPLPWQCLCQGVLATWACYTLSAMDLCLYLLSSFSATVLFPWGLQKPLPSAPVSCQGPLALWTV